MKHMTNLSVSPSPVAQAMRRVMDVYNRIETLMNSEWTDRQTDILERVKIKSDMEEREICMNFCSNQAVEPQADMH